VVWNLVTFKVVPDGISRVGYQRGFFLCAAHIGDGHCHWCKLPPYQPFIGASHKVR